jgi:hypothetical protein
LAVILDSTSKGRNTHSYTGKTLFLEANSIPSFM